MGLFFLSRLWVKTHLHALQQSVCVPSSSSLTSRPPLSHTLPQFLPLPTALGGPLRCLVGTRVNHRRFRVPSPPPRAEHAGHPGCCSETHPEAAGGCGPLVSSFCPAAPGLGPLRLFFHLLLTFALLLPDDLESGRVTKGANDW